MASEILPQTISPTPSRRTFSNRRCGIWLAELSSQGQPNPGRSVTIQLCGPRNRMAPGNKSGGRLHDLRHTYGSLKIEQGENLKYIQTQMGHSSIRITLDIYGHLLKDTNPEAAERTDRLVFGTDGKI
jgi:integrase